MHMDDLLKLPSLGSNCRVKDLRAVLDQLTIHVLGISAQQYGSLLTPIVMSKLPSDIRLLVARKTNGSLLQLNSISMAVPVRILFDGGSQRSYITKDLRDRLGLSPKRVETLNLSTFGDKVYRKQRCELVELELFKGDGDSLNISALTFPQICSALPSKVDLTDCPAFESLDLVSDASCDNKPIDILIGSDLYWEFVSGKVIRSNTGLVAIESKFGWILSGTTEGPNVDTDGVSVSHLIVTRDVGVSQPTDDLKLNLQRFWETESIGIFKEPEEKSIKDEEELFQLNIERESGRYSVNLPWKTDGQPLPTHYELSKTRLTYLQQRLQKNKELMKKYDDIIEEQLQAGIVEPVSTENENRVNNPKIHYLPHHAVVREDKTTKVRIVFNGSAKLDSGDLSINECLERGPNLVPSLFDILVRFRSHAYALVADIEKAFHMISTKEEDRDSLQFLWLKSVEDGGGGVSFLSSRVWPEAQSCHFRSHNQASSIKVFDK